MADLGTVLRQGADIAVRHKKALAQLVAARMPNAPLVVLKYLGELTGEDLSPPQDPTDSEYLEKVKTIFDTHIGGCLLCLKAAGGSEESAENEGGGGADGD